MTEAQTLSYIDKAIKAGKLPKEKLLALYDRTDEKLEPKNLIVAATHDSWKEVKQKEVMIQDILLRGGQHVFAGLFETYKTMFALALSNVLLTNPSLAFSERGLGLKVNMVEPVEVVFLCPDMDASLFRSYAAQFGLMSKPGFYTLNPGEDDVNLSLESPELQEMVKGRVLILDTMWDYACFEDAHKSGEWIKFFQKLRRLVKTFGAVATILLAHPTKAGATATDIDPTKFLKDSVTFGGKIDVGLAFRPIEKTSNILVSRIKGRGFKQRDFAFTITTRDEEGNSYLDRGEFPICEKNVDVSAALNTRKNQHSTKFAENREQVEELVKQGKSDSEIAKAMGISNHTAKNWRQKVRPESGGLPF